MKPVSDNLSAHATSLYPSDSSVVFVIDEDVSVRTSLEILVRRAG